MFKRHYLLSSLLLVLAVFALAACGGKGTDEKDDNQAQISAAVEATLTVIAAEDAAPPALSSEETLIEETPDASEAPATPASIQVSNVTLPPAVNDFNPIPRPASSMGDPNAPVVMYEWSDYT